MRIQVDGDEDDHASWPVWAHVTAAILFVTAGLIYGWP